ncbi:MAG: trypsin-like peptidase domain-containing protein, partial [Gammaproteobacteria bacterium]
ACLFLLLRPQLIPPGPDNSPSRPETQPFPASTGTEYRQEPISYQAAVAVTAPAVVNVYASKVYQQTRHPLFQDPLFQRFFGEAPAMPEQRRSNNLGSGVIMNGEGYVLTNAHVILEADDIRVTLRDGRQTYARIVGIDPDTDLAVLQITMEDLPAIPIGDSSKLRTGDVVLAIGNPYDFGQTVTQGIVSATGRKRLGITTFEDFIQTDADINPGNSGGALITARGKLIGINTAIISNSGGSEGIGFATPIDQAIDIMQQIIVNGRVVRGWLGIEAQLLSPDIIEAIGLVHGGVLVAGVLQNGPAEEAGIIPGDIIISLGGKPATDPQQAIQLITELNPGTDIEVTLLRGWDQQTLRAKVAQRPSPGLR